MKAFFERLYDKSDNQFYREMKRNLQEETKMFIITANPEAFMYGEKDKQKKAKEYKHMTFYEAADIARKAEVKEMWLTHYSPSLVRPSDYVKNIKSVYSNVCAAKDGQSVTLTFEDEE